MPGHVEYTLYFYFLLIININTSGVQKKGISTPTLRSEEIQSFYLAIYYYLDVLQIAKSIKMVRTGLWWWNAPFTKIKYIINYYMGHRSMIDSLVNSCVHIFVNVGDNLPAGEASALRRSKVANPTLMPTLFLYLWRRKIRPRIQAVYGLWYFDYSIISLWVLLRRSGRQCVHTCIHAVWLNLCTFPTHEVDIFQSKN